MCPIPKESRGFVVDDGMCDCWADADYTPPEELDHLMSERECEQAQDEESELEDFEIPTPRRAKSFQQRLAEKKTRAKRLNMANEACRWRVHQAKTKQVLPPTAKSAKNPTSMKNMAPPAKSTRPQAKSTTESCTGTESNQAPRCIFGYNFGVLRGRIGRMRPSSNRFKTPTSKDKDTLSQRSFMSTVTRQRMLDALEWDSD
ncbi:hypothetical protein HBH64_215210 [Parastagonospora nodorum]|nr:hypothetical protein HBH53_161350 [Parastagonospora nodorum]KAH3960646.1 hypothetical protein HBH51_189560 [Parastagonospora nodorum]KAH3962792.1 hypothetical protein HBH52_222220 [Parastagonospora nodorum]KAH4070907.1 hypothetical protein HBH50_090680 [Parastagonospora nodorum]KAH4092829.1 hypothetical protein HBH48_072710 [Parastagonospora nodorum]